jgi:hypothetical protein
MQELKGGLGLRSYKPLTLGFSHNVMLPDHEWNRQDRPVELPEVRMRRSKFYIYK